jgi:hypothetical protein
MIRHCAFFRFKADLSEPDICRLLNGFLKLAPKLQGVIDIQVGQNSSPEGLERGFHHGLIMDFTSSGALNAYLDHPEHVALATRLLAQVEGGVDAGVMVFDLHMHLPPVEISSGKTG